MERKRLQDQILATVGCSNVYDFFYTTTSYKCMLPKVEAIATENAHRYGYRAVWVLLKTQYRIFVARSDVEVSLRTLFPAETAKRSKRVLQRREYNAHGAKYAMHVDGGDKLKYYGFSFIDDSPSPASAPSGAPPLEPAAT